MRQVFMRQVIRQVLLASAGLAAFTVSARAEECEANAKHWTYGGETGPNCWSKIDPRKNRLCAEGRTQSPVKIRTGETRHIAVPHFPQPWRYPFVPLSIWNNGHAIQLNIRAEGPNDWNWNIGGRLYALKQIHFHAPSEHWIDDKQFPLEMHMVHETIGEGPKRTAVRATLFEFDRYNSSLYSIFRGKLPAKDQTNTYSNLTFNPQHIFTHQNIYFEYTGSLTTPDCAQPVYWRVDLLPATVYQNQVEALTRAVGFQNNRPFQAIKDHSINRIEWREPPPPDPRSRAAPGRR